MNGLTRKIYVASSWRNEYQQQVVASLRSWGHEVYDFRNPPQKSGFSWRDISPDWQNWTPQEYREALRHPVAIQGFNSDFSAMNWADTCVLVLPSGRSASFEFGWCKGQGKYCVVYQPVSCEPELMYLGCPITTDLDELKITLGIPNCYYCRKAPGGCNCSQMRGW